jgi:hypothetical protein
MLDRVMNLADLLKAGSGITDPKLVLMRESYSEEFIYQYSMAYRNYLEGEWDVAKRKFEELVETTLVTHKFEDGPSMELLHFMGKHGLEDENEAGCPTLKAPAFWKKSPVRDLSSRVLSNLLKEAETGEAAGSRGSMRINTRKNTRSDELADCPQINVGDAVLAGSLPQSLRLELKILSDEQGRVVEVDTSRGQAKVMWPSAGEAWYSLSQLQYMQTKRLRKGMLSRKGTSRSGTSSRGAPRGAPRGASAIRGGIATCASTKIIPRHRGGTGDRVIERTKIARARKKQKGAMVSVPTGGGDSEGLCVALSTTAVSNYGSAATTSYSAKGAKLSEATSASCSAQNTTRSTPSAKSANQDGPKASWVFDNQPGSSEAQGRSVASNIFEPTVSHPTGASSSMPVPELPSVQPVEQHRKKPEVMSKINSRKMSSGIDAGSRRSPDRVNRPDMSAPLPSYRTFVESQSTGSEISVEREELAVQEESSKKVERRVYIKQTAEDLGEELQEPATSSPPE